MDVLMPLLLLVAAWALTLMIWWLKRDVFADRGLVGEHGRHVFNAAMGLTGVVWSPAALIWLLAPVVPAGAALEWVTQGAVDWLLVGLLVQIIVLQFLRPRLLVPPHLRERRGWIPESLLAVRKGQQTRRVRQ